MKTAIRMRVSSAVLVAAFAAPLVLPAAPAWAQTTAVRSGKPTAIVAMGDSYISGEGGRWMGNSTTISGSRSGTDRAYIGGVTYRPENVYGATFASGCDRSDVAQVQSNAIQVDKKINIACSTARAVNLLKTSSGGKALKGEAPEGDQLYAIARDNDVKAIMVSVGGNDVGFGDILKDCITDYLVSPSLFPHYCHTDAQKKMEAVMSSAMAAVGRTLDDIRSTMRGAGYADTSYKIIFQGPFSVVPRGNENRYAESGMARTTVGGCPMWNADATWARDEVVPLLAQEMGRTANEHGAVFLDLQDAFQGRELCSKSTAQADDTHPPTPLSGEWARYLNTGLLQGTYQESLHPNYYGQKAIGACYALAYASPRQAVSCRNRPGADWTGMYLSD